MKDDSSLREQVRERYAREAKRVLQGTRASCCGSGPAPLGDNPITSNLYGHGETGGLPAEAIAASNRLARTAAIGKTSRGK